MGKDVCLYVQHSCPTFWLVWAVLIEWELFWPAYKMYIRVNVYM